MDVYCVKCKKFTKNSQSSKEKDKHGKLRIKATCNDCGTKKYRYIKAS